jgi:hypothetical protein
MEKIMKATASKKSISIPTTIGAPGAGGFLAGRFFDAGKPFGLIVAPKAEGEKESIAWHTTMKTVKGALSYSDGVANTAAMVKAGSALAQWAAGLTIGGFKDWYLPSRLEALLLFGELRGIKAFDPGKPDGFAEAWYWTSTQYAGYEGYAWYQSFGYGHQYYVHKDGQLRARAVRRLNLE